MFLLFSSKKSNFDTNNASKIDFLYFRLKKATTEKYIEGKRSFDDTVICIAHYSILVTTWPRLLIKWTYSRMDISYL